MHNIGILLVTDLSIGHRTASGSQKNPRFFFPVRTSQTIIGSYGRIVKDRNTFYVTA